MAKDDMEVIMYTARWYAVSFCISCRQSAE